MESSEKDPELVPEAIFEKDGLKVSKSPWGPEDEIGRLNWITPERRGSILERLSGAQVFDLNVDYFIDMPSWTAPATRPYEIWMTHTPQGSVNDDSTGAGAEVHETYSLLRRRDLDVHALRHAHRHAQPRRASRGSFWNGWTPDEISAAAHWNKGGADNYPPIIARGVLLDVAGMHGVDCLDRRLRHHAEGPPGRRRASRASSCARATSSASARGA